MGTQKNVSNLHIFGLGFITAIAMACPLVLVGLLIDDVWADMASVGLAIVCGGFAGRWSLDWMNKYEAEA